jgi:mono/diheme cytochrome c family protein
MRILAVLLLTVLAACGSARRGEPILGQDVVLSPTALRGERVFMAHCHQCHPGGEAGLGPPVNNVPTPGFLMRFQVRHGLGAMPSFGPDQVSPADLDALVAYLGEIR